MESTGERTDRNLVEPLTPREQDILFLLAKHLRYQDIGSQLIMAVSTVKWYANQIYSKLGVNNRRDAIQCAQELGLLKSEDPFAASPTSPDKYPTGLVTFLFADIEGSAPLWEQMPDAMRVAVAQHHKILRDAVEANGGQVFQVVGEASRAAFRLTSDGLYAALAAQHALLEARWGPTGPLKVRMGLHTGPAELDTDQDAPYKVNHTLDRVARIMSAGLGGMLLLSQEAADLVVRELPQGVTLKDLGEHRLKGMNTPERLVQVMALGLPEAFPPLSTASTRPNNLPVQLTSFIGHAQEIGTVSNLLSGHRMVTLTGSGGVGKTRLSQMVAGRLLPAYACGAWLVELASLADPALVPQAVATALGLQKTGDASYLDMLANYLRERQFLLILDNCEHLLEACAWLCESLLTRCPQLTLLATSREALRIQGETVYRVPSLDAPDPDAADLLELAHCESVLLFANRAAAILPGFQLVDETLPAVAHICHRLDGIPLAIELAAARVGVLSVEQIAVRLDDRFRLLTGGSRTALPRQRTLRASIDWSYALLPEPEQRLLQRLSVFGGGWTLEAAEQVCAGDGVAAPEILDGLAALVNKSLVVADHTARSEARFHMLETIRQYAQEKLEETGQGSRVRDRHLEYYLALAQEYGPLLRTPRIVELLDQLDVELDNLRSAISWALGKVSREGAVQAIRIMYDLLYFWFTRALAAEITAWAEQALSFLSGSDDTTLRWRARACYLPAFMHTLYLSNEAKAKTFLDECIPLFRRLESDLELAQALALDYLVITLLLVVDIQIRNLRKYNLEEGRRSGEESLSIAYRYLPSTDPGTRWAAANAVLWFSWAASVDDRFRLAKDTVEQAASVFAELGDMLGEVNTLPPIADICQSIQEWQAVYPLLEKGVIQANRLKSKFTLAWIIEHMGVADDQFGNYAQMVEHYQECVRLFRETGYSLGEIWSLRSKGFGLFKMGETDQARACFQESFYLAVERGEEREILLNILFLADFARKINQILQAVKLFGYLDRELAKYPYLISPADYQIIYRINELEKSQLGEGVYQRLWQLGQAMTREQAIAEAGAI